MSGRETTGRETSGREKSGRKKPLVQDALEDIMFVRTFSAFRQVGESVVGEPVKPGERDQDDQSDE